MSPCAASIGRRTSFACQAATTLSGPATELAHQRMALEALAKRFRRHEELLRALS